MDRDTQSRLRSGAGRPIRTLLLAIVLVVSGGLIGSLTSIAWRSPSRTSLRAANPISIYKNTSFEVQYAGDQACAQCHAEIAASYRKHPMGRSLAPIASAPSTDRDPTGGRPVFAAQGLEYFIEQRDGNLFHRESRRDASGRVIAQHEGQVQYVVGSGRFGFAYLIEREGFLFQSPIAWYARAHQWDLPPGYQTSNARFNRPIQSTCLYCHANRALAVEGTVNRYRDPIFLGHAIGCERCHGPGELHVSRARTVKGPDLTIVNPAKLEPSLRDAVCEQCHLNGQRRVLRAGRRDEDFRPGLPFQQFWTVLEPAANSAENRFVGQFEQMHASSCFEASRGRMGCISCHDPHREPETAEKADYYRDRCLQCHSDRGCSVPTRDRADKGRPDDCVRCHMPRLPGSNIVHVAETNHRISRHGDEGDQPAVATNLPAGRRRSWVNFHRDLMDRNDLDRAEREVALVNCHDGPDGAARALPVLEIAIDEHPTDVAALEGKGFALGQLGRGADGLAAFQQVLAMEPFREATLTGASFVAAQAGQLESSIAFCERAIGISPYRADYRAELAALKFRRRDWHGAKMACEETLTLDPANLEVRRLLIRCHIRLGDLQAARIEFDSFLAFDPPDRDELLQWFGPALNNEGSKP